MMTQKLQQPDTEEELKSAFRVYDHSCQGSITTEDLERTMENLHTDLNPEEVAEMIRETDTDGDGHVTYQGTNLNSVSVKPLKALKSLEFEKINSTPAGISLKIGK